MGDLIDLQTTNDVLGLVALSLIYKEFYIYSVVRLIGWRLDEFSIIQFNRKFQQILVNGTAYHYINMQFYILVYPTKRMLRHASVSFALKLLQTTIYYIIYLGTQWIKRHSRLASVAFVKRAIFFKPATAVPELAYAGLTNLQQAILFRIVIKGTFNSLC